MKALFSFWNSCRIVFLQLFTFEINMFSNKIPEAKHLHLRNGSRLTSLTVQFFCLFHGKWIALRCFRTKLFFSFFSCVNLTYFIKNPWNKASALVKWCTINYAKWPLLLFSFLFDENCICVSKFLKNCVCSVNF